MPVYFLHAADAGLIKIGFSALAERVAGRLRAECRETGSRVVLLGVRDGTEADERALHMRHAMAWHLSEWFEDTPAVRASAGGLSYVGPDVVDEQDVRDWLRSWRVSWREISRVSGVGLGRLAYFADGGQAPRLHEAVALGRGFLLMEKGLPGVRLPVPKPPRDYGIVRSA